MFAESAGPHVMKGDLLDLDFTMDMDHRKRRRNRTTQSCLNCHTSKRKCDRKRPCQRCIQLGLTGLCVYEVDDPALRDDPDIDETTRLRNRIAELESLVRELRGKPHPRWADPNYYEGDASDKWHTRSQKRNPNAKRRPHSPDGGEISVKTEPATEAQQQSYYRLSPSPPPSATYSNVPHGQFPPNFDACANDGCSPVNYSPASPESTSSSNGINGAYQYSNPADRKAYIRQFSAAERAPHRGSHFNFDDQPCAYCHHPTAAHSFMNLARELEGTLNYLSHLPEHHQNHRCGIFRRVLELRNVLHGEGPTSSNSPPFGGYDAQSDALRSPVESDLMTPLSITSSVPPNTPHSIQSMHWGDAPHQNGGYNPYFPNVPPVPDVYSKAVPTYDVVT